MADAPEEPHDRPRAADALVRADAAADCAATVRVATVDDARALAVTQIEGWRWGYRDILPAEHLASLSVDARAQRWTEILRDARPPQRTWSAWDARGCAGFVSVGAVRGEPTGAGEIYALYVAERAAGRGVARVLMERARADLREAGFRAIVLWVLEANHRARRFYEREGFRADGAIKEEVIGGALVRELLYTSAIEDG